MSLEDTIRANTEAVRLLTNTLMSLKFHGKIETSVAGPVAPAVSYETVKALIQKHAVEHREEIKAINKHFGLKVFADMLTDPEDPSKGVKSTKQLQEYYEMLENLG